MSVLCCFLSPGMFSRGSSYRCCSLHLVSVLCALSTGWLAVSVLGYGVFEEPLALDPGRVTGRVVSWNVLLRQSKMAER